MPGTVQGDKGTRSRPSSCAVVLRIAGRQLSNGNTHTHTHIHINLYICAYIIINFENMCGVKVKIVVGQA